MDVNFATVLYGIGLPSIIILACGYLAYASSTKGKMISYIVFMIFPILVLIDTILQMNGHIGIFY